MHEEMEESILFHILWLTASYELDPCIKAPEHPLCWVRQLRKDPIHRKIIATKKDFENKDFEALEALGSVIDKSRFFLNSEFSE